MILEATKTSTYKLSLDENTQTDTADDTAMIDDGSASYTPEAQCDVKTLLYTPQVIWSLISCALLY